MIVDGDGSKIEAIRQEGGLDIEGFDPESSEVKFASSMSRQPLVLVETMCCYHFSKVRPQCAPHVRDRTAAIRPQEGGTASQRVQFDGLHRQPDRAQRYRLVTSRGTVAGSAVWPSRFEAKISGIYNVQFDAPPLPRPIALPAPMSTKSNTPARRQRLSTARIDRKVGEVRMVRSAGAELSPK